MKRSFYLYQDTDIRRKDNTIQLKYLDGSKKDLPIEQIDNLYVMTEASFNTKLINILSQYGIVVHFFNYYDYYTGTFYPKEKLISGRLLVKQVEHYTDINKRLSIAKEIVNGAADAMYRNLRYYNSRGKDLKNHLLQIDSFRKLIDKQLDVNELMGIEGNIKKTYYDAWNIIINQDIDFTKRVKHPPDNMINTLISFVNSLVYTTVISQLYITQLNPTISYLHEPGTRRFSLSLDIAELFKPLIGDRMIFSLLNKNVLQEKHFVEGLNYLQLTKEGSMIILREYDDILERTLKHKDLNRNVSYKYLIRLEGYKLVKHLLGEKEYKSFRIWW